MIDWSRAIELRNEIGADDFQEVLDLFLQEVEEALDRLMAAQDAPEMEATMHFLKGSALNLGFASLAKLCQSGETAASSGDTSCIDVPEVARIYFESKCEFLQDMATRLAA